jgi:hypothetical protein
LVGEQYHESVHHSNEQYFVLKEVQFLFEDEHEYCLDEEEEDADHEVS